MTIREDILQFLKENKTEFFEKYGLIKMGLFGSYARNGATELSDIDILVEFEKETQNLSVKKAELKSILKSRFNADVDICREKYIKSYFKNQILQSAIYV